MLEAASTAPTPDKAKEAVEAIQEEEEEAESRREFGLTTYANTKIDNPEVRKAIESRCGELNFQAILQTNRVSQVVPILPKKFEVEFQTLTGTDLSNIDRIAASKDWTHFMFINWAGYAKLVFAMRAMNGQALPPVYSPEGEFMEEVFNQRYKSLVALGEKLITLLFVNYRWFDDRVEGQFSDGMLQLKNG
jgi:hypothetical protein